jgi:hypothetical protein
MFFLLVGWDWVPRYLLKSLGTAATLAYCTNPDDRWGWFLEQLVEWRLAGETEVVGENLPQRYFVHHKIPHDQTRPWTPDRRGGKPATNRLSYGAALTHVTTHLPSFDPFVSFCIFSLPHKVVSIMKFNFCLIFLHTPRSQESDHRLLFFGAPC